MVLEYVDVYDMVHMGKNTSVVIVQCTGRPTGIKGWNMYSYIVCWGAQVETTLGSLSMNGNIYAGSRLVVGW